MSTNHELAKKWGDEARRITIGFTGRVHDPCLATGLSAIETGIFQALNEADTQRSERVVALEKLINTPEFHDFVKAVPLEAAHQVERWGTEHDGGKEPEDWFWLIGYLAGKALRSHQDGNKEKALHHTVTIAAAACNWHAHVLQPTSK